jgi:hypothetical protein
LRKILGIPIAYLLLTLAITATVAALATYQLLVPTTGVFVSVDIQAYNDPALTQVCSSITWGTMSRGTTSPKTIYVKNIGNQAVSLVFTRSNYNPAGFSASTFTTDYDNSPIAAGANKAVVMTLGIPSSYTQAGTAFGFDLTITSTGG